MADTFKEIDVITAWQLLQQEQAVLVDIRDSQRFAYSHCQGAFHLTNQSYGLFCDRYDFAVPVLVICYHGNSSRNVAQFLVEQGFDEVYSVRGGFDAWVKAELPVESGLIE
ncbi:thiosulfate sulfurtransferase GlpE [Gallibacterium trehalosifermentans]|uniref:Thiosulfate sulfurtransferase GlpE n=1 Tax=Gallibacterium trehalosifermentans TaxID=516935 RepID=A0ABV6H3H4_9PAST